MQPTGQFIPQMRGIVSTAAGWLARAVVLYALWLALIDNVHRSDLITGIPCALLAAALSTAAHGLRGTRVHPRPRLFARLPLTLVSLITDTGRVTFALLRTFTGRPVHGRFRAVRVPAAGDTPQDAGRRALTELAASLAPNRYVLGIDDESGVMVVHELVAARAPLDPLGPQ